jgi:hypothetical protein
MVLALAGGILGGALATRLQRFQTSTMNWQTFSQVAFGFAVTPKLLTQGIIYALVMGLLAGISGHPRGEAADFEGAEGALVTCFTIERMRRVIAALVLATGR